MSITGGFLLIVLSQNSRADSSKVSWVPRQRWFVPGKITVPIGPPHIDHEVEDSCPELD